MLVVNATAYMLNPETPVFVRSLSLFHLFLAPSLFWVVFRLGYDSRALLWQTVLSIVILQVSYVVSDPVRNINWVHGFGSLTVPWSAGAVHVLMIMLSMVFAFYLPTHVTLKYYFGGQCPGSC